MALIVEHGGVVVREVENYTYQIKLRDSKLEYSDYYEKAPIFCERFIYDSVALKTLATESRYKLSEHHFHGVFLGERRPDIGVKKRIYGQMKPVLSAAGLEWTLRDLHIFYKLLKDVDRMSNEAIELKIAVLEK